eukprot:221296-Pelagomonas_calceolata.AAC.1
MKNTHKYAHTHIHPQAAGTKGKRFAMKNTRIMMTQPMGGSLPVSLLHPQTRIASQVEKNVYRQST